MQLTELSNLITFNPWSVSPQTTLAEWLSMWSVAGLEHWPVIDEDRRLLGMVSNADLLRILHARCEAAQLSGDLAAVRHSVGQCPLSEIMSPRVVTADPEDGPGRALRMLLDNQLASLPILEHGRLVGLVTTGDFIREFSYGGWSVGRETATEQMQRCEQAVDCDCAIDEAAALMRLSQTDFVSVLRGDLPLGIVSLHDLQMAKLRQTIQAVFGDEQPFPGSCTILELAATAPTIRPGERLSCVASLMVQQQRQAVAVVNQAGRLLGAITEDTLLQAMLEALR